MLVPVLFALQSLATGETCPAATDVQARVRNILHLTPEQQLAESFLIERHEAGLYVVLKGADSSVIGERTLPLAGSCDELAQAAAVVLSAWLTDVHPDFAGALPAPASEPDAPAPTPEPKQPPPAKVASPSPPVQRPAPVLENPGRFDGGLSGGADFSGRALAPAALVSFGYGPERFGLGLTALAVVTTARDEPLGGGLVSWRRWPLELGANLRLSSPALRWDISAGPAVAWLHLEGENFDQVATKDAATWGGFLNLRVSGRGAFAPFGLVNLQIYPGDEVALVDVEGEPTPREWPLPLATFLVTFGARFAH